MAEMANPIHVLIGLEEKLRQGMPADPCEWNVNYKKFFHEFDGGRRFIFAKVVNNEVQAISIFGREDPFRGTERYSVGYAVRENCRGRGLSIEAVDTGIRELSIFLGREGIGSFYLEAVIDEKNIPSIKAAEKLFPLPPSSITDSESGTAAKLFYKRVAM